MRVVVCLAGLSSRFRSQGFDRPKYELDLAGRPILERVLAGFDRAAPDVSFMLVSLRSNDLLNFCSSSSALSQRLARGQLDIVELPEATRGQAETVAFALRQRPYSHEEPLIIFNGDTIYRDWNLPADPIQRSEGYLDVTQANGTHWSFARLANAHDRSSRVVETAEKRRISDNCSTGLYAFRSGRSYLDLYSRYFTQEAYLADHAGTEYYIAPMYNALVDVGEGVRVHDIKRSDVAFVGTPEEYHSVRATWDWD